jgi:hypothetical protein
MRDDELLARFEDATLPNQQFHHRDHVHVAWLYLERLPVLAALDRFSAGLRAFAAKNGKPGLYHETITWAFVFLIQERRLQAEAAESGEGWEGFAARNADLLTWKPSILDRYYRQETLASERARHAFVLPDRTPDAGAPSP